MFSLVLGLFLSSCMVSFQLLWRAHFLLPQCLHICFSSGWKALSFPHPPVAQLTPTCLSRLSFNDNILRLPDKAGSPCSVPLPPREGA